MNLINSTPLLTILFLFAVSFVLADNAFAEEDEHNKVISSPESELVEPTDDTERKITMLPPFEVPLAWLPPLDRSALRTAYIAQQWHSVVAMTSYIPKHQMAPDDLFMVGEAELQISETVRTLQLRRNTLQSALSYFIACLLRAEPNSHLEHQANERIKDASARLDDPQFKDIKDTSRFNAWNQFTIDKSVAELTQNNFEILTCITQENGSLVCTHGPGRI